MNKTVRVKTFLIGDVEDPDFYVTNFLIPNWFESPHGKFVKENAIQITKYFEYDLGEYYFPVYIDAIFESEKDVTAYYLMFDKIQDNS